MTARCAKVIGFVGGIGSGKSAVARRVGERLGAPVIDADQIGHWALTREDVTQKIRERFGPAVFHQDGTVDRRALAERVFGPDPSHRAARLELEQIVHPVIEQEIRARIARHGPPTELILLDAAVLLEAGWNHACDAVVFVDAPRETRWDRVRESRNWTREDFERREASQWPLDRKRESSDVVIQNTGTIETAGQQFLNWYDRWLQSTPGC